MPISQANEDDEPEGKFNLTMFSQWGWQFSPIIILFMILFIITTCPFNL